MKDIAHSWRDLRKQLPVDLKPYHVVAAIQSSAFEGITQKAWGWFLSAGKNVSQFKEQIIKQHREEQEIKESTKASIRRAITYIKSPDDQNRLAAIGTIVTHASYGNIPRETAQQALQILTKDSVEKVRNEAELKLELL